MGIPISRITLEREDGKDTEAYLIRKEDYYLRDPGLEPDELAALHLAAAAVRMDGLEGMEALWKLGGAPGDTSGGAPVVHLPADPRLTDLFAAVSEQRVIRFALPGQPNASSSRTGSGFQRGRWYITGPRPGAGRRTQLPARPHRRPDRAGTGRRRSRPVAPVKNLTEEAWEIGEEPPVEARLLVDAGHVAWAAHHLDGDEGREDRPDGSAVFTLQVTNRAAFRSFVFGFLEHAEILAPDRPPRRDGRRPRRPRRAGRPRLMARPSAVTGFARLLAMIPWIAAHDGPTVDEVCARFGIARKQLLADLDVLPFVGLYPYTPDQLVEVLVEDDRVWIRYAPMFERPLRLTPDQALALVAAGSTLLAVPGAEADGPLARGLAKLRSRARDHRRRGRRGRARAPPPPRCSTCSRRPPTSRSPVRITYYAHNRDERTERVIEPWRVFADQGQWYVQAWCRSAPGRAALPRRPHRDGSPCRRGLRAPGVARGPRRLLAGRRRPESRARARAGRPVGDRAVPGRGRRGGGAGVRRVTLAVSAAPVVGPAAAPPGRRRPDRRGPARAGRCRHRRRPAHPGSLPNLTAATTPDTTTGSAGSLAPLSAPIPPPDPGRRLDDPAWVDDIVATASSRVARPAPTRPDHPDLPATAADAGTGPATETATATTGPAGSASPTTRPAGATGGRERRRPCDLTEGPPSPEPGTTLVLDAGRRSRTPPPPPAEHARRGLVEWLVVLAGVLLVALLIKTFLVQAYFIPSGSMSTTLAEGDRVAVSPMSYELGDVSRGDVVVFDPPERRGRRRRRRSSSGSIGLPNESIEIEDSMVIINGIPLDESYVGAGVDYPDMAPVVVPEDHVFVMGDNRPDSRDSRTFGPIAIDEIDGRALAVIWPPSHLSARVVNPEGNRTFGIEFDGARFARARLWLVLTASRSDQVGGHRRRRFPPNPPPAGAHHPVRTTRVETARASGASWGECEGGGSADPHSPSGERLAVSPSQNEPAAGGRSNSIAGGSFPFGIDLRRSTGERRRACGRRGR